jgi:hypothetical protein
VPRFRYSINTKAKNHLDSTQPTHYNDWMWHVPSDEFLLWPFWEELQWCMFDE